MPVIPLQVLRDTARTAIDRDDRLRAAGIVCDDAAYQNDQVLIAYSGPGRPRESVLLPRSRSTLANSSILQPAIADAVWFMVELGMRRAQS